jgi:hypothetical protein
MSRGRGGSISPIVGLVVLVLTIAIGVIIFGTSMQSVYTESNYTADNQTLIPYQMATAWWGGVALLALIVAFGFIFWHFWG